MKPGWIDLPIPENIKSVFVEFGEKINYIEGDIILDETRRCEAFYYVLNGVMAAILYENCDDKGIIAKFIPKNRIFGFSEFFCGKRKKYRLAALRDSSVYKLSYGAMEYLIKNKLVSRRLFKLYGWRAMETKHSTLAAMAGVAENDIPHVVNASLSSIKDWDEYGRYKKVVELTGKELAGLKYIDRNRRHFRRGKERIKNYEA